MSSSQLRLLECALKAANAAAQGEIDLDTAKRIYGGARRAGVDPKALRPARIELLRLEDRA